MSKISTIVRTVPPCNSISKKLKKKSISCCNLLPFVVTLHCRNDDRSLKKCPHQSRSGYSSNFYEMPRKRRLQWRASTVRCLTAGGLQRWRCPQILYLVGVSSHPLVWLSINRDRSGDNAQHLSPFYYENSGRFLVVIKKRCKFAP